MLPALLRSMGAIGRTTLPILDQFLIDLDAHGQLRITATDLEIQITAMATVDVEAPGLTTVPARKLTEILRLMPDVAAVSIDASAGERVIVKSGRSRYSLATMPAEGYPAFDRGAITQRIELPASALLTAISKTRFAVARGDVRFYLNGLALEIQPGMLRTVASDGHRLALCEMPLDTDATCPMVIVPAKGIDELSRLLREDAKVPPNRIVSLGIGDNSITATIGHVELSSRLIEGRFPDYRRVMPNTHVLRCRAGRLDLTAALQRVLVLADDKSAVALRTGDDAIELSLGNSATESADDTVATQELDGEPRRDGYCGRYLLDGLNIAEGDSVALLISDNGACVIEDVANANWRSVVMPMRI
jgi:DNA polymerase-3 subunit beta